MKRMPVPRVLRIRCLRMETFEKHIVNVLNRWARENNKYGEFFFVKSYKRGVIKLYKDFELKLLFRYPFETVPVWQVRESMPIKTEDVQIGYEEILEALLYNLLFDKDLWNLINTKLP